MSTKTVNKNISSLQEALNIFISGFFEEMAAKLEKDFDVLITEYQSKSMQKILTDILQENLLKTTFKSKEAPTNRVTDYEDENKADSDEDEH